MFFMGSEGSHITGFTSSRTFTSRFVIEPPYRSMFDLR